MSTRNSFESGALEWIDFIGANSSAQFQLALLISGDPRVAEDAVVKSIANLDVSGMPGPANLAILQASVALQSIKSVSCDPLESSLAAQCMLPPELWPVLRIDRLARICFVLRLVLHYTSAVCAEILEVQESEIQMLVSAALLQLRRDQDRDSGRPEEKCRLPTLEGEVACDPAGD